MTTSTVASQEEQAALEKLVVELAKTPPTLPGREWLLNEAGELTYLRFLRGHQLRVKKVVKLLKNTARWRVEYGTNDITKTWPLVQTFEARLIRNHWPMAVTGKDFDQRPVHYFHMAHVDFPALVENVGVDILVRHNVYLMEMALQENPRGEAIMIVDLGTHKGLGAFSFLSLTKWLQAVVQFVKAMAKIADPYYPESYFRIYFIRVHKVFEKMYKTMSSNLAENTLSKVQVLPEEGMFEALLEDIPKESLPETLGGESKVVFAKGGLISDEDLLIAREGAVLATEELDAEDDQPTTQAAVNSATSPAAGPGTVTAPSDKPRQSIRKSIAKRISKVVAKKN
mmetsp:Transcript_14194/g.27600  ORF Transcript_14194/g.27600 Transcript_14194/m.27600 type:complete len:341 (-) Transcript_14194:85-1107(-)|eukprot:CAMPEP_0171527260 /NCGR_PEP_ID=MMETSP0959-20130129/10944_1 /TAXON_ID=87120 /ORGANISM="Aurantiochytrium limacinum, Strain ATCCMYA-1381" /LENGTH=340 /DNA_ID=CAMNT_0012068963 /DNA_START=317 /DNA_END=1339 /DNA_ORIENTATION=+